jgi:hypothetical protein
MGFVHADQVFHDFESQDVNGKRRFEKGPADTIEFQINYTLKQKYQQYWIRFWYVIDDDVKFENDSCVLDIAPRYQFGGNLTVDKYALDVRIPTYSNYFWRMSANTITRYPDSVTEDGSYTVFVWRLSGREIGTHIIIKYQYELDVRQLQSLLVGVIAGLAAGEIFRRLTALRRNKKRATRPRLKN